MEVLIEKAPYIGSIVLVVFMFLRFLGTHSKEMRGSIDANTKVTTELYVYLKNKNGGK